MLTESKQKVFIAEDEIALSEIFRDYLVAEGYDVTLTHSGKGVVDYVRQFSPDLVILDLMLPEVDGLSICKSIRRFSDVPVIIVTAKVDEIDRLLGFETGADDYICKPAKPKEIVARVKAVLRRAKAGSNQTSIKQIQLDQASYIARWEGRDLELTRVEFRLLSLLVSDNGQIFSRSRIMNSIYEDGRHVSNRSIDTHVKNLRHKLSAISHIENPIQSVYGVGYKLEVDPC